MSKDDVPIIVYGLRNIMGCPSSQLHTHIGHEKASMQLQTTPNLGELGDHSLY